MTGIKPVIPALSTEYRLGIIAKQPREVESVLKKYELWEPFQIHGISQTIGLQKPDLKFFEWALEQANCPPHEAIMIGDRIDNDVRPAKAIGMKTIWLTLSADDKGFVPKAVYEKLYLESSSRYATSALRPEQESETPNVQISQFNKLIGAIKKIEQY